MNRIDRLNAIVIQLQSKRIVKAQEIADRFEISLRTVYRDIRSLEEAGVPLLGEAGVGYSLMEGYRLPPVMFTMEEATAFLTAEKFMEKLTDTAIGESYKSAMYKIRAVLRSSEKEHLEAIDEHIDVLKSNYLPETDNKPEALQIILRSISQKKLINLNYYAVHNNEYSDRKAESVGVFYQSGYWYLIAFCCLRNDYRTFRLDRIKEISLTEEPFKKEHPTLKKYLKEIKKEKKLTEVILNIDSSIVKHLGDQKYYHGFVSQQENGDTVEMRFLAGSIEGFARWFIMFGEFAEIIKPVDLRERVIAIINAQQKKFRKSEAHAKAHTA